MREKDWTKQIVFKDDSVEINGQIVEKEVQAKWQEIWEEQCKIDQSIWGQYEGTKQKSETSN